MTTEQETETMETHTFTVTVRTGSASLAHQVMKERICVDEDYGFDYKIDYNSGGCCGDATKRPRESALSLPGCHPSVSLDEQDVAGW